MSFVHLHVHTEYSLDAISKIDELFIRAEDLEMPGLAITDHGTISGVPEFLKAAERHPTVKPIVGCEFWLADKDMVTYHLILLAKNLTGYKNLVKLVSYANTEGIYYKPRITREKLIECHEGLICTSACIGGEIPQMILHDKMGDAITAAQWYKNLFGEDFYLEVSLHKNCGPLKLASADNRVAYKKNNQNLVDLQKVANAGIFQIAEELGIKVVATNDVHFVNREDGIAHDVKLALTHDKKVSDPERIRYSHLEYLKNEDEMRRLFPEHPEVIDNTMEVLDKVERYSIWKDIELPKASDRPEAELIEKAYAGAEKRFGEVNKDQQERLGQELEIILGKGVASYFLIIQDLVDWVRSKGWVVGPGRGAAAGSLVNYCLGITDIDPMKYGLLFERFYCSEQISLPCIDLDLEQEAQEKIQEYLKERYGQNSISGIVTFGRYGPRGAWSKTAKALGIPHSLIERLNLKLSGYWGSLYWNLREVPEIREMYYNASPEFRQAYDIASKLSDVIEGESIHACGWMIAPSSMGEIVPVQIQEGSWNGEHTLNSMYDGRWTTDLGVLRLNILSLMVLREIRDAYTAIEAHEGIHVEPEGLALDDELTMAIYSEGDTTGVFQFESEGMQEWLRKLRPSSFSDLVAMEALYRPGAMDLIPSFVARKKGEEAITYPIPRMEEILGETYGIIVYQEQTMRLAEKLAGFTPEKADKLRKAFGKRNIMILETLHDEFIDGGAKKGYNCSALQEVWDMMDSQYTFNKSHAVCYTWISYQMAWLKAHYPKEFYLAFLNQHLGQFEELDYYIQDAANHNVFVIPPDKSKSGMFEVIE